MLRHHNYFVTSHRAEVHYYVAYSIIFCELKWHCYHPKQVMNTGFPVCILYHLNQVTICFIVIIFRNGSNTWIAFTQCHHRVKPQREPQ